MSRAIMSRSIKSMCEKLPSGFLPYTLFSKTEVYLFPYNRVRKLEMLVLK